MPISGTRTSLTVAAPAGAEKRRAERKATINARRGADQLRPNAEAEGPLLARFTLNEQLRAARPDQTCRRAQFRPQPPFMNGVLAWRDNRWRDPMRGVLAPAALLFALALAPPAAAQWGPPGGGWDPRYDPRQDRYDRYDPRWEREQRRRERERREWERRRAYGPGPQGPGPYGPPHGRSAPRGMGNICTIPTGSCSTNPAPRGSPCACFVPGRGQMRGVVQ
jgi:hypothetical protein